jgi:vancomycin permeability regulator SanA
MSLVALVLLAIGYYAVTVYQVHSTGRSDQSRQVDAIVVMGAAQYDGRPSPQLAARLDHAADLWAVGLAKVMVVTGGNQLGDRFTEASASAKYLIERGVPAEAILQESLGHSSYASLDGVATLLHERGLFRVLVVSDPFHSLRSRLIAEELGLVAYVSPTRTSPVRGKVAFARELQEAAGIAVGRIIGFKRLLSITG